MLVLIAILPVLPVVELPPIAVHALQDTFYTTTNVLHLVLLTTMKIPLRIYALFAMMHVQIVRIAHIKPVLAVLLIIICSLLLQVLAWAVVHLLTLEMKLH